MRSRLAAAVGVVAAIWMMFAPAALGYGGSAAMSARIVGPTAAALAWIAATQVTRSLRWGNVALGAWAVAAPLLLDHSGAAAAHSVITGLVLIVSGLAIGRVPRERYAGGWKALIESKDGTG